MRQEAVVEAASLLLASPEQPHSEAEAACPGVPLRVSLCGAAQLLLGVFGSKDSASEQTQNTLTRCCFWDCKTMPVFKNTSSLLALCFQDFPNF